MLFKIFVYAIHFSHQFLLFITFLLFLALFCCDAISDEISDDDKDADGESRLQLHILWFGLVWYAKVTLCSGLVTAEQNTSVQTSNNVI